MKCSGKKIFITGANRGMGKGFALEAEKRGAHLYLHARKWTEDLKNEFEFKDKHKFIEADLCEYQSLEKLLNEVKDCDIVINNAGVLTGDLIENQSDKEIQQVMTVNSIVPMQICRYLIPYMLQKKEAMIVNNTSVSAVMRFPLASTYAASKASLAAFSECLQNELDKTPIKVLVLFTPGIQTDMFKDVHTKYSKNLDVSSMSSMSVSKYASIVLDCIESGKSVYNPAGSSGVGLFLARYLPWVFNFFVKKSFSRIPS